MTSERWEKLDRIFHQAEMLEGEARLRFLDEACAGDVDMRAQLGRMLANTRAADAFLANAVSEAVDLAEEDWMVGSMVGVYRIEKLLGRGGMGAVYLARRADGSYDQQVAIKMIRGGFTSDLMAARFRAERQILAGLEHPHICRLLDGGIASNGAPYLVMEYVEGVRIDEYCATRNLAERDRLELVALLLSAVECAHQNLVVHRDIKPGNVLVDDQGVVKLLDFGIAKLLRQDPVVGQTVSLEILATPEYASPEQLRGEPVTTASDVYSLGALLAVLLPRAKGEVAAIVAKARHEDVARRYVSVGRLAEDVRRYLNGFPVLAQADSWTYRASKFVRRNPLASAAALVAVLSMVAGVVATRREQMRTEQRFNEVRELATSFLFEFHDSIENLPGSIEARRLVVSKALRYLRALSSESTDPMLNRDVAEAYGKVSRMQWQSGGSHLGDPQGARDSALQELALRKQVVAATPKDLKARLALAASESRLAAVLSIGLSRNTEALPHMEQAGLVLEQLDREAPGQRDVALQMAVHSAQMGQIWMKAGDPKQALAQYEKAIAARETMARFDPKDFNNRRMLGWGYVYAGDALGGGGAEIQLGDRKGAMERTAKGVAVLEALASEQPNNATAQRDVISTKTRIAGIYEATGNLPEALAIRRQALEKALQLFEQDPRNADAARTLYTNYHGTGLVLMKLESYGEAAEMVRKAAELNQGRIRREQGSLEATTDQANVEHLAGELAKRRKDAAGAARHLKAAIELRAPWLAAQGGDSRLQWRQAKSWQALGEAQEMLAERPRAALSYESARQIYADLQRNGLLSPAERDTPAALKQKVEALRR